VWLSRIGADLSSKKGNSTQITPYVCPFSKCLHASDCLSRVSTVLVRSGSLGGRGFPSLGGGQPFFPIGPILRRAGLTCCFSPPPHRGGLPPKGQSIWTLRCPAGNVTSPPPPLLCCRALRLFSYLDPSVLLISTLSFRFLIFSPKCTLFFCKLRAYKLWDPITKSLLQLGSHDLLIPFLQ